MTYPEAVILKRTKSGVPCRVACPLCDTEISTEAFEFDPAFEHDAKLKQWFTEHFEWVHVND